MLAFCLRRILGIIPIGFGVITLVALITHIVPGDPVDAILGQYATQEDKEKLTKELGLDKPLPIQLLTYYESLARGDLGKSLLSQRPVASLIGERIRPTMELALCAIIVAILVSVPLGIISALNAGKPLDFLAMGFSLIGVAMPNFWFGSMLILIFSIQLDLLPVSERGGWQTYVLPSLTMGIALSAVLCRMTRNNVLDTLKEDYVRTARAKGNREYVVIGKHVLRNAALPLITIIGLQFGVLLTGAVITEVIFDWPGLGTLILEAVRTRDYPIIQGCVLMFACTYLFVNLATDLLYAFVDPRIKIAS